MISFLKLYKTAPSIFSSTVYVLCVCFFFFYSLLSFAFFFFFFLVFKWFIFCGCFLLLILSVRQYAVRISMTWLKVEYSLCLLCVDGVHYPKFVCFFSSLFSFCLSVREAFASGKEEPVEFSYRHPKFALHAIRGIKLYQQFSSWYSTLDGIQRRTFSKIYNTKFVGIYRLLSNIIKLMSVLPFAKREMEIEEQQGDRERERESPKKKYSSTLIHASKPMFNNEIKSVPGNGFDILNSFEQLIKSHSLLFGCSLFGRHFWLRKAQSLPTKSKRAFKWG